MLQSLAVCCSMLQCVAVCCSVLQCDAVCCSVLQCVAVCCSVLQCVAESCSVLYWRQVATHSKVKHTATHCNTPACPQHLHCDAIKSCCSVLCCCVLQSLVGRNTLKSKAYYNTLQYTCVPVVIALHCNTLQHTATDCNTLQHAATHCNTL